MRTLDYEVEGGRMFHEVAKSAIEFARKNIRRDMQPVEAAFKFNDIPMTVRSNSSAYDICLIYDLKNKVRRLELGHKD